MTPLLLILGILAQIILLAAALVLYVPCLIWPGILDGTYQRITKGMARIFAKSIMSKRHKAEKVSEPIELPFRYRTRRFEVPPEPACLCYNAN